MDFLDFLDEKENVTPFQPIPKRQRSENRSDWNSSATSGGLRVEPSPASAGYEGGLHIPAEVSERLYSYQQEGIDWLFEKHKSGCGCILADEMGLGKTVQVSVFLGAMIRSNFLRTAIVIVPGTLLQVWSDALVQWGGLPLSVVEIVHKGAKQARAKRWQRFRHGTPFVAVTTYGIMKSDAEELRKITVDYAILDEAHLIKDPSSECFKGAKALQAVHRIAVTGTPLMNNYNELWSLMNFADANIIKCTRAEFAAANHDILRGNEKDATAQERGQGAMVISALRQKTLKYILRREKASLGVVTSTKQDYVVWVRMSDAQSDQYRSFLDSDLVQVALRSINTSQPLVLLTALKRICDHPWLNFNERNFLEAMSCPETPPLEFQDFGDIHSGPKLRVAQSLIQQHVTEGQRTIVFSRSKRLLHMLAHLLRERDISFIRFDGDTPISERAAAIKGFNEGSASTCLATTQVGGVGVTFIGASRVILLDPSWNPAADAQAVDRVHRIGQTEDVIVYRLVTSGTVDEKVYRNQIFKMMAARQMNTSGAAPDLHRYFTHTQLRNMFEMSVTDTCDTARQLLEIHPNCVPSGVSQYLSEVLGRDMMAVSSHSVMFTETAASDDAPIARPRRVRAPRRRTPPPPPGCAEGERVCDDLVVSSPLEEVPTQTLFPSALNSTISVPAMTIKPRCTIFAEGNAGAIQLQDCADALVMVRGVKFARIHMSQVHRGSIALDINEYMLDSDVDDDEDEGHNLAMLSADGSVEDWGFAGDGNDNGFDVCAASNPADSERVSLVEDFVGEI